MTIDEAIKCLAAALQRASEHHGRPNSFSPGELREYGGPPATLAGRVGASSDLRVKLYQALGGRRAWGSAPTYQNRRFGI